MNDLDVNLMKLDEVIITAIISRVPGGLRIHKLKTHPVIENLLREWGGNEFNEATKWGRQWIGKEDAVIKAWNLTQNPGPLQIEGTQEYFCLDRVGAPLYEQRTINTGPAGMAINTEVLNMSFLRIVGISEQMGADITLKGVFTPQLVTKVAKQIQLAAKTLYTSFLKPIDITIKVISQPWQGEGR